MIGLLNAKHHMIQTFKKDLCPLYTYHSFSSFTSNQDFASSMMQVAKSWFDANDKKYH